MATKPKQRILVTGAVGFVGQALVRALACAHKAMLDEWIATLTRRGAVRGLSLRLPGIVARPQGPSGMTSAFMSNLLHH